MDAVLADEPRLPRLVPFPDDLRATTRVGGPFRARPLLLCPALVAALQAARPLASDAVLDGLHAILAPFDGGVQVVDVDWERAAAAIASLGSDLGPARAGPEPKETGGQDAFAHTVSGYLAAVAGLDAMERERRLLELFARLAIWLAPAP